MKTNTKTTENTDLNNVETPNLNLSLRDENATLGQIIESEMTAMGLDPRNKEDCEFFWKNKGLVE